MARTTTPPALHVRWMIARDMPEVLALSAGGSDPWDRERLLQCLRLRNCIGMVAEQRDGAAVGFVIYELHKAKLHILTLGAATPAARLALLAKVRSKVEGSYHRNRITISVPETDLAAQLAWRADGWRCVAVDHDGDSTTYRFCWRAPVSAPVAETPLLAEVYADDDVTF
jgi:ribosomal-protein-alanine N-acetyltransferase